MISSLPMHVFSRQAVCDILGVQSEYLDECLTKGINSITSSTGEVYEISDWTKTKSHYTLRRVR
ncbi:MAG: hypothetical protein JW791_01780 [Nanoarchaeota archaeon]|nr:hypothetical protein [Nanoarchaeota archaeon]